MRFSKTLLFLMLFVFTAKGFADFTITNVVTKPDHPDFKETAVFYSTPDKFKVENSEGNTDVIFHAESKEMYIIQHDQKGYRLIDEEYIEKMSTKFNSAMKKMEEQLKNLPEAQREKMKEMMGSRMPKKEEIEIRYEKTGDSKTHKNWSLDKYKVYQNEDHEMNYWVSDLGQLNITSSDFEASRKFSEFMEEMFDAFGSLASKMGIYGFKMKFNELNGIPLITEQLDNSGDIKRVSKVTDIDDSGISDSVFEIPSGYKELENDMMME